MAVVTLDGLFTHDVLELCYVCNKCNDTGAMTMDYGPTGKRWRFGRYTDFEKKLEGVSFSDHKRPFMKGQIVKDCFNG